MALAVDLLTLFPSMVVGPLSASIPARVQERGLAQIRVHDLRDWGLGRHRSVDDYTYGGGAGMVLRPEPVATALDDLRQPGSTAILVDPAGRPFDQSIARDLAQRSHLIFVCPRYEGADERIRSLVDLELSIGDYVLTGGELPALVIIDAVLRLLPGAIEADSTVEESFSAGLLEYPQYTRPPVFRDMAVPPILVGGDHGAVRAWRLRQALARTLARRPDLLAGRVPTREEASILAELRIEAEALAAEAGDGGADGAPRAATDAGAKPDQGRAARRAGGRRDRKDPPGT